MSENENEKMTERKWEKMKNRMSVKMRISERKWEKMSEREIKWVKEIENKKERMKRFSNNKINQEKRIFL